MIKDESWWFIWLISWVELVEVLIRLFSGGSFYPIWSLSMRADRLRYRVNKELKKGWR